MYLSLQRLVLLAHTYSAVILTGAPLNSFELIKPIVEGVGYTMPQRELSVKSAMTLAWGMYAFYGLLYPWLQKSWIPEPFILPAEVFKVLSFEHVVTLLNCLGICSRDGNEH